MPATRCSTRPHGDPRIGCTIAGFFVEECVSSGPLASVYRARRGSRPVALKIYHPRAVGAGRDRIQREAAAQARIAHRCVAPLLEWGHLDDGAAFLASAWIPGRSLAGVLDGGSLPASELVRTLDDIGAALAAIHALDIVHRDLKPANVILEDAGAAVVIDFGHALLLDDARLTERGQVLGSAAYMAPEHASGGPTDSRADLYSLGVILYQALTGTVPFVAASSADVLQQHLWQPVTPPRRRAPDRDIPAPLEDLCLWLLAKDPQARVPSARIFRITLRAIREFLGAHDDGIRSNNE
jgi:eukaryotic-like serine/threonine-protein kinase